MELLEVEVAVVDGSDRAEQRAERAGPMANPWPTNLYVTWFGLCPNLMLSLLNSCWTVCPETRQVRGVNGHPILLFSPPLLRATSNSHQRDRYEERKDERHQKSESPSAKTMASIDDGIPGFALIVKWNQILTRVSIDEAKQKLTMNYDLLCHQIFPTQRTWQLWLEWSKRRRLSTMDHEHDTRLKVV